MQRVAIPVIAFFAAVSCGGTTHASPGAAEDGPGTGQFSVTSDQPSAGSANGASYSLTVSFTTEPACPTTTVGACTINPCYQSASSGSTSAPAPSAGSVTFAGTGMSSLALDPQSDGNYATESVAGQVAWQGGGEPATFEWAHFPGNAGQPGDRATLSTPPYIALTAASAFASATSTLARDEDLTVSWTNDTVPTELDDVSVNVTSDSVQVYCIFSADAGSGVVPAAALSALETGEGAYNVVSKEHIYETINDGSGAWGMNFNVNALARSTDGLAKGTVTLN